MGQTQPPTTEGESNPQDHAHLQIDDEDNFNDTDSAYGSSVASSSVSLASSITHYKYENGRRYHAFREGEYYLPNDEEEQARLDLQHHIYRLCLSGALYLAPISNPQTVLDIGTGTGIWAIEFADEYPGSLVIGTDLSPIQPGFVPPNVKFYVDDFEQDWEFPEVGKFDYIHWRSLSGSTGNWDKLYGQALRNLKEGGFVDVQEKVVKCPIGPWTRDPSLKELGRYERWHMNESVEAHSMALYTRVLNYTPDQAKVVFERVKMEFN